MKVGHFVAAGAFIALVGYTVGMMRLASAEPKPDPATAAAAPKGGAVVATVTLYGAGWCSACKTLREGLDAKGIPYQVVDVDENPGAYAMARKAAGAGNSIPLTGVARGLDTTWIVGANVGAVAQAYNGS